MGTYGVMVEVIKLFHKAVQNSLKDYLREIERPESEELRENLWTKMNHICNVRIQRGAVYACEA